MTDVLDLVNDQHAELQSLAAPLGAAIAAGDPVDEGAVGRLVAAFSAHDALERGYLFPLVASRLDREGLLEAIATHGEQSRILAEIERRALDDPHRMALLGSMVEEIHRHVHDEQALLSRLRAKVATEELERVGAAMEAALPRAPTRPHPHLGGSGAGARLSAGLLAPADHLRDRLARRPRQALQSRGRPGPPQRVDVLRILEQQHRQMATTLEELAGEPGDEMARGNLADYVVAAMARHETAEELVVWPAVRRRVPGGQALVDEALRQEREGRFFLDALRVTHDDAGRRELAGELLPTVRAHMAFEEDEVWPRLQRVTSGVSRIVMGARYQLAYRIGPTRPHPHGPDRSVGLRTLGMAGAMVDRLRDKLTGRRI